MSGDSTKLRDPQLKRLRAVKMLHCKVQSAMTNKAIAAEFKVSEKTVERTLDWAKRAGIVTEYEDEILTSLVPAAIKAFATALESGDTQVALEVLKGTGLLKKQTDKPLVPQQALNEDDLAGYIRKIRGGGNAPQLTSRPIAELVAVNPTAPDPADGTGAVVDGDVLEDSDLDPAPPAPAVCPDSSEDCAPVDDGPLDLSDFPA